MFQGGQNLERTVSRELGALPALGTNHVPRTLNSRRTLAEEVGLCKKNRRFMGKDEHKKIITSSTTSVMIRILHILSMRSRIFLDCSYSQ